MYTVLTIVRFILVAFFRGALWTSLFVLRSALFVAVFAAAGIIMGTFAEAV